MRSTPISGRSRRHPGGGSASATDFDARFSAVKRHYLYRMLDRRAPPVLDRGRVWWVGQRLDAEAMHEAAQALVGKHDFTTFRSSECQAKSPVKTLDRLDVSRAGDEIVVRSPRRAPSCTIRCARWSAR